MPTRRAARTPAWALAACLAVTGCTSDADPQAEPTATVTATPSTTTEGPPEPVTLRLAVYGEGPLRDAWRELAASYSDVAPHVTVDVTVRRTADRALADRASEVGAGDVPDVFLAPSEAAPALTTAGAVVPVDELLAQRGITFGDTYLRLGLEAFSAEQHLQCMPVDVSPYVVIYREDLLPLRRLADRGEDPVTPEDGWTWEQFAEAARLMSRDDVRGLYVEPRLDILMALVRSGGADLVDDPRDATTLTLSDDATRATLEEVLDVLREPRLTPTQRQLERKDALERFVDGQIGMMFGTRDLVPALREAEVPFDVLPLPRLGRARTVAEVDGLCLSEAGVHREEAADFLAWATGPGGAEILARTGAVVPSHVPTLTSAAFLQPLQPPDNAAVFVEAVARADVHPFVPRWPDVSEAIQSELEELFYAPVIDLDTLLPIIDAQSRQILEPEPVEETPSPESDPDS